MNTPLHALIQRWNRLLILRRLLIAAIIASPLIALALAFKPNLVFLSLALLPIIFFAIVFIDQRRKATIANWASHLNRIYPQLQDSAQILFSSEQELNTLQKLQKKRLLQFQADPTPALQPLRIPHFAKVLAITILASALSVFALDRLSPYIQQTFDPTTVEASQVSGPNPPQIRQLQITIKPPAYTQSPQRQQGEPDLTDIQEGAEVTWVIKADQALTEAIFQLGADQQFPLTKTASKTYSLTQTIGSGGFYGLNLTSPKGSWQSQLYKLLVKKDRPPQIRITQPQKGRTLLPQGATQAELIAQLSDDYQITSASLRLTLARGTGEAVKFEEITQALSLPKPNHQGRINLTAAIPFDQYQLDPGDEIYAQIEAADNRQPHPNRARSAVFIFKLAGGDEPATAQMDGVAVDRMPDFFRSQRQIIIDTERLIADRSHISENQFMNTGLSLGVDQKILRLRYGKFLGEEFEAQIGPEETRVHQDDDDHHDHDHDHDHEHGHDEEKEGHTAMPGHDHGEPNLPGPNQDEKTDVKIINMDILQDFIHHHDSAISSYLPLEVKKKLSECLAEMWDSEKYLRLGYPDQALPYQYRALKLLKEVQQADRVYLAKIETDLPPLDPKEWRFKGETDELRDLAEEALPPHDPDTRILRYLLSAIQLNQAADFSAAHQLLETKAAEEPEIWLDALNLLTQYRQSPQPQTAQDLAKTLWPLIPDPTQTVSPPAAPGDIARRYRLNLTTGDRP